MAAGEDPYIFRGGGDKVEISGGARPIQTTNNKVDMGQCPLGPQLLRIRR